MSDLNFKDLSDEELDQVQKDFEKQIAECNRLEGENHDLQRKLGILEKEVVSLVPQLLKYANELEAKPQQRFIMVAGGMTDKHTAIATLLEQP